MEQLVGFVEGENGKPGYFISPLPLKPFNINSVRGNRSTADDQNRQMVIRLQQDPEALEQVKDEMAKLQKLGFIVKLKQTSASTKTMICWDSSRSSKQSASLNSILLKGTSEYNVVKMLVRFRENKYGVSADIQKFYNTLKLDPHGDVEAQYVTR